MGIKDLHAWNKEKIAKLIWVIAEKKDTLWVKWVHGKYLKNKDWWDYAPHKTAAGIGGNYATSKKNSNKDTHTRSPGNGMETRHTH